MHRRLHMYDATRRQCQLGPQPGTAGCCKTIHGHAGALMAFMPSATPGTLRVTGPCAPTPACWWLSPSCSCPSAPGCPWLSPPCPTIGACPASPPSCMPGSGCSRLPPSCPPAAACSSCPLAYSPVASSCCWLLACLPACCAATQPPETRLPASRACRKAMGCLGPSACALNVQTVLGCRWPGPLQQSPRAAGCR